MKEAKRSQRAEAWKGIAAYIFGCSAHRRFGFLAPLLFHSIRRLSGKEVSMRFLLRKQGGQRVLIVDSDMAAAAGIVALVAGSESDCEVVSAGSGFEGIQKIENGVVNIVLAAEKLVDMTGTTFINILQSLKRIKKKELVCVLMAENRKRVQTAGIDRAGSFDVIRSPVDSDELAYVLDRALDWDELNRKIGFNEVVWKVLLGLVPVAVVVGGVLGAF